LQKYEKSSKKKFEKKFEKKSLKKKFEKKLEKMFEKKLEKITNCWRGGEGRGGEGGWRIVIPMPEAINFVDGRRQKYFYCSAVPHETRHNSRENLYQHTLYFLADFCPI
jgi:hypothetical protein